MPSSWLLGWWLAVPGEEVQVRHDQGARVVEVDADRAVQRVEFLLVGQAHVDDGRMKADYPLRHVTQHVSGHRYWRRWPISVPVPETACEDPWRDR